MIPDRIIFGPGPNGGTLTFAQVRTQNEQQRINSLKLRLDTFSIAQIGNLATKDELDQFKVYSPFPLAIMSCVAIESTGQIFVAQSIRSDDPRCCFREVTKRIDKKLYGPMQQGFKSKMRSRWPDSDLSGCHSASDVIFKFFRNSMIHGYRAFGVYLTEDETRDWKYDDGFILLNPYWLWPSFVQVYEQFFELALQPDNKYVRRSCLQYINKMLS